MNRETITAQNIWPLTIVLDRYGGSYSGGKYTAWNLEAHEVPEDINGDDTDCMFFWWPDGDNLRADEKMVGKGNTAQDAIDNLIYRLNQ